MILSVIISFGLIVAVIAGVDFSVFFLKKNTEKFLYFDIDGTDMESTEQAMESGNSEGDAKEGARATDSQDDFAQDDFAQDDFMTDEIALDSVSQEDAIKDVSELAREFIDDVYGDVYGSNT